MSDTGSHLGDNDYERDGFVVDDVSDSEISSEEDVETMSKNDRKAYEKRVQEEEDAFIAENMDKIVNSGHTVGGRVLRTRRKPKTTQEVYDELCRDVEDHEEELAEIEDELEAFKGKRLSAKEKKERDELKKDQSYVKERLLLLRQRVEDMEEDHRTYHGDIDGWEAEQSTLEKRLDELEEEMAAAERASDDKAYTKAGKEHKRLSTKLTKVEKQIADYHAEQDVAKGGESGDDSSDVSMDEEPYSGEDSYSEDESDYSDEGESDYSEG